MAYILVSLKISLMWILYLQTILSLLEVSHRKIDNFCSEIWNTELINFLLSTPIRSVFPTTTLSSIILTHQPVLGFGIHICFPKCISTSLFFQILILIYDFTQRNNSLGQSPQLLLWLLSLYIHHRSSLPLNSLIILLLYLPAVSNTHSECSFPRALAPVIPSP